MDFEELKKLIGKEIEQGYKDQGVDAKIEEVKKGIKDVLETMTKTHTETKEELTKIGQLSEQEADIRPYTNMGEQLLDIREATKMSARANVDLLPKKMADWTNQAIEMKAISGASEIIDSEGGYLLQDTFSNVLLERIYETSPVPQRVWRVPIGPNSNSLVMNGIDETSRADGSRAGGVLAYWSGEATTVTAKKPKFRRLNLMLDKLMAVFYATDELLEDATALGAMASRLFGDEMDFKLADGIINGSGVGMPLGIMNGPDLITVSKETGQQAATLDAWNIIKMYARMYSRSMQSAVFFISQDILPQLITMNIPIGTAGALLYMPAGGLSAAPYGNIFGRPVIPIEQCKTLGTAGDIIFTDLSQYLLIEKGGLKSAQSIHVKFLEDETTFRFTYRVNGQPTWHNTLTPFNTGDTISPTVVIQTRS